MILCVYSAQYTENRNTKLEGERLQIYTFIYVFITYFVILLCFVHGLVGGDEEKEWKWDGNTVYMHIYRVESLWEKKRTNLKICVVWRLFFFRVINVYKRRK